MGLALAYMDPSVKDGSQPTGNTYDLISLFVLEFFY